MDRSRPPEGEQPGVFATPDLQPARPDAVATDEAVDCVEAVGASLALPGPPAGSWASVRIPIVSP